MTRAGFNAGAVGILAVALVLGVPFSANAAETHIWSPAADLSFSGQTTTAPQVAAAPNGVFTAVWQRSNGSHTIIQASRSIGGAVWTPAVDLSAAGGNETKPRVAVDANGNFTAVWMRLDASANTIIQASHSTDGAVWGTPVDVSVAGSSATDPQIVASPDGGLTAVWKSQFSTVIQSSHSADGTTWSRPSNIPVAGLSTSEPKIIASPDGSLTVAWSRLDGTRHRIQVSRSLDGLSWSAIPVSLSADNGNASVPRIAVAFDGTLAVIWQQRFDGDRIRTQASVSPDGTTWSVPADVAAPAGQDAMEPEIQSTPDGSFAAIWYQTTGTGHVIQTSHSDDGILWSPPATLATTPGNPFAPHLAIASDGTRVALFRQFTSPNWVVLASTSDDGITWSAPVGLSGVGVATLPQVAVAPDGTFAAVWSKGVIQSAFSMTPPLITSGAPNSATAGEAYSFQISGSGNPAPTYAVTSGVLPTGLALSPGGLLSGIPASTDSATFTVTASNGASPDHSVVYTITPLPPLVAPLITSGVPTIPTVGELYSFEVTASGNPAPAFAATGDLPAGLTLSPTGLISGVPTSSASATFTVTADNGVSPSSARTYTVTSRAAAVDPPPVAPAPADPVVVDPVPADPAAVDPAPAEPAASDPPALADTGTSIAPGIATALAVLMLGAALLVAKRVLRGSAL